MFIDNSEIFDSACRHFNYKISKPESYVELFSLQILSWLKIIDGIKSFNVSGCDSMASIKLINECYGNIKKLDFYD